MCWVLRAVEDRVGEGEGHESQQMAGRGKSYPDGPEGGVTLACARAAVWSVDEAHATAGDSYVMAFYTASGRSTPRSRLGRAWIRSGAGRQRCDKCHDS